MIFKNSKVYDILKWISLTALDAVGLLYSTLASIWGLPLGDEIMRTCAAVSLCIGTLIGVSSIKYARQQQQEQNKQEQHSLTGEDNGN